jgi:hypothetical protein
MTESRLIYRHRLWVRITHWINVVCMTVLLMSGLQIFNADPTLYWGNASNFDNPLVVIGVFPDWATLPGSQWLAMGRRWHFFFAWLFVANGAVYALLAMSGSHLRRDLAPSRQDLQQIGYSIRQHVRLRFPKGRGSEAIQRFAETHLPSGAVLTVPADRSRRARHVAATGHRLSLAAVALRRTPVGTHDPLRLRLRAPRFRRNSPADGSGLGRLEQHPVDDHRLV